MGPNPPGPGSLQEEVGTRTHSEGRPCEDTGGDDPPSTRVGERPQEAQPRPGLGLEFQLQGWRQ